MKILLPPAARWLALLLCLIAVAPPLFGISASYPVLKASEHPFLTWLFCAGLLLFALAGKATNTERWFGARKKALRDAIGWLVIYVPIMALADRHEDGSLGWFSVTEVILAGLGFFNLMTTFYFYNNRKAAIAE